jgi:hypothetical protein
MMHAQKWALKKREAGPKIDVALVSSFGVVRLMTGRDEIMTPGAAQRPTFRLSAR